MWQKLRDGLRREAILPEKKVYPPNELVLVEALVSHFDIFDKLIRSDDSGISLLQDQMVAINLLLDWDMLYPQEKHPVVWLPLMDFVPQAFKTGWANDQGITQIITHEIPNPSFVSGCTIRRINSVREREKLEKQIQSGAFTPAQIDEMLEQEKKHIQYFFANYHPEDATGVYKIINWQARVALHYATYTRYVTLAAWVLPSTLTTSQQAEQYLEHCGLGGVSHLPILLDKKSPFARLGQYGDETFYLASEVDGQSSTPVGQADITQRPSSLTPRQRVFGWR